MSSRSFEMYRLLFFNDHQVVAEETWDGRSLESVITHAHNALIRGPATRFEITRRADGHVVFRGPSIFIAPGNSKPSVNI
jgi:hypothetical protein